MRLALSAAIIFAAASPDQAEILPARRIIDVHLHAYPANFLGQAGPPDPITGAPSAARTTTEIRNATIQAMREHGIVKAVLSGPLDVVDQWRKASPDLFLASPHFPLLVGFPDVDALRQQYETGELRAMAEITGQYAGLKPDDPALQPYLKLAEEMDIPVGFHMGLSAPGVSYGLAPEYRASGGNPLHLEGALLRHPTLRVYIMHAGWPFIDETVAVLWAHPRVYVGLGGIDWLIPRAEFHRYLKRLVGAGFGDRIMFGSDQMVWPEVIGRAVEAVESADFLTEGQRQDIFYNNAARFLRIEEGNDRE